MANVLSVQNALRAEENAVQVEEIARLRGLLETHASHGNQRVNHEKILEPMDVVDHSPHGTLCSLPTSTPSHVAIVSLHVFTLLLFSINIVRHQLPSLILRIDSGCGSFQQPLSNFSFLCLF
jgi:hypothetical protein